MVRRTKNIDERECFMLKLIYCAVQGKLYFFGIERIELRFVVEKTNC